MKSYPESYFLSFSFFLGGVIFLLQIYISYSLKEGGREIKIRKENLKSELQSFDLFLCNPFMAEIKMRIFSYFSLFRCSTVRRLLTLRAHQ